MKRSPLKRSTKPMKRTGKLGPGKKQRQWEKSRAKIKANFQSLGTTYCEFGYEGCLRDAFLGFAHACKRVELSSNALPGEWNHIETVAVACVLCHQRLDEKMSHAEMKEAAMGAINRRRFAL